MLLCIVCRISKWLSSPRISFVLNCGQKTRSIDLITLLHCLAYVALISAFLKKYMTGLIAEFRGTVKNGSDEKNARSPSGCCLRMMRIKGGIGKAFKKDETDTKRRTVIAA